MNPLIITTLASIGAQVLSMVSKYANGELTDAEIMQLWEGLGKNMLTTKAMWDEALKAAGEQDGDPAPGAV